MILRFTSTLLMSLIAFGPETVDSTAGGAPSVAGAEQTKPVVQASQQALNPAPNQALMGDPERGQLIFHRCRACHSVKVKKNGNGTASSAQQASCDPAPNLYGVLGREVGALTGCTYSTALTSASFVWTPERLDQWLQSPNGFLPGNRMAFQAVTSVQARQDLIAYLATLTDPE